MLDKTSGSSNNSNNSNSPSADSAINKKAFDETRKIVDAFLRRSLSHNARVASNNLKPVGRCFESIEIHFRSLRTALADLMTNKHQYLINIINALWIPY